MKRLRLICGEASNPRVRMLRNPGSRFGVLAVRRGASHAHPPHTQLTERRAWASMVRDQVGKRNRQCCCSINPG